VNGRSAGLSRRYQLWHLRGVRRASSRPEQVFLEVTKQHNDHLRLNGFVAMTVLIAAANAPWGLGYRSVERIAA
jgi:hypothetical protein